jgi:AraC-like DNA-binding protein
VSQVPHSVRDAVRRIVSAGGNLRIETLASDVGVTRQGLAKQFATHVGLTPKTLARITRTRLALARADAARAAYPRQIDWSAISYDLGYYDQPHIIDELKTIVGATPGEWLDER